jgi:uncharacterized membrane protein
MDFTTVGLRNCDVEWIEVMHVSRGTCRDDYSCSAFVGSDPIIEYTLRLRVGLTPADSMRQSAHLVLDEVVSSKANRTLKLILGISVGTLHDSS